MTMSRGKKTKKKFEVITKKRQETESNHFKEKTNIEIRSKTASKPANNALIVNREKLPDSKKPLNIEHLIDKNQNQTHMVQNKDKNSCSQQNKNAEKQIQKDKLNNVDGKVLYEGPSFDKYSEQQDPMKVEQKNSNKRLRRKSKAWKAKVVKIRNTDVVERVALKSEVQLENVSKNIDEDLVLQRNREEKIPESPKHVSKSFKKSNAKQAKKSEMKKNVNEEYNTNNFSLKLENDSSCEELYNDNKVTGDENRNSQKNDFEEIEKAIQPSIANLTLLFEDIVGRYKRHWKRNRELGHPEYKICQADSKTMQNEIREFDEKLLKIEKDYENLIRLKFVEVIAYIKKIAHDHDLRYKHIVESLKNELLNHEVRGGEKTSTQNLYAVNRSGDHTSPKSDNNFCNSQYSMEDEMNYEYYRKQDLEYVKVIIEILGKRTPIPPEELEKAKKKTELSSYHLIESIERLIDSESDQSNQNDSDSENALNELLFPYSELSDVSLVFKSPTADLDTFSSCDLNTNNRKTKSHVDLSSKNFFNILSHGKTKKVKSLEENKKSNESNCVNRLTIRPPGFFNKHISPSVPQFGDFWKRSLDTPSNPFFYVSRWSELLSELKHMKDLTRLAGDEVRISAPDAKLRFIISSGGNFGDVKLGIDSKDRALAVKSISKQKNAICKVLKSVMNPLLDLRHKHLLHFAVCEYDENQLIVATPLCDFNMGEYLMCLKMRNLLAVTPHLAKQLLFGLRYLHDRPKPIVHGNLKPSNVFIDSYGIVKIAEFGVFRALYQTARPPKSSVIWFARETYQHYELLSSMLCTKHSDIQVTGMMLHFILTGGLHPFGVFTEDILENLLHGNPTVKTTGCDLLDLITWMLVYEATDRPNVLQILSHVYFWDSDRKWRFVLACAGLTPQGMHLNISLTTLHSHIDAAAAREHIKGDWVSVIKTKCSMMQPNDDKFSDTPTGLLRYICSCVEERQVCVTSRGQIDLQQFFLDAFPVLPLTLFRLLESTEWLQHPVFCSFNQPIS